MESTFGDGREPAAEPGRSEHVYVDSGYVDSHFDHAGNGLDHADVVVWPPPMPRIPPPGERLLTPPVSGPPVDSGQLELRRSTAPEGPAFGPGAAAPAPAFRPNRRSRGGSLLRPRRAVVSVDNNRCHLYAICQMEAPTSFLVARDGRLYYDAAPSPQAMPNVRQAARLCPMQAIDVGNE